jgi:hypothetical protein
MAPRSVKLGAHLREDVPPDLVRSHGVGLVHERHPGWPPSGSPGSGPLAGQLEPVPDDPLHALVRIDADHRGDLVGGAHGPPASHLGVEPLCVLPNYDEVDVLGALVLQRPEVLGVELDGPEVHEQVEAEAEAQDHRALDEARLDAGMPDGAQQNGVQTPPLLDDLGGHELAGLQVVGPGVGILDRLVLNTLLAGHGLEDAQALVEDLGPDAVTAEDTDAIGKAGGAGHGKLLSVGWKTEVSPTEAPPSSGEMPESVGAEGLGAEIGLTHRVGRAPAPGRAGCRS